jgi:hypothetical protein
MKRLITLFLAWSIVMYFSGKTGYGQGKGPTFGAAGQSHVPAKVKVDVHAKDVKFDKQKEADNQAKEVRKEEKEHEKIVGHIERNPHLKASVQSLLRAGMSLKTAAMGFHNEGKFIAALHVSKNFNIPFDQLKSKLTSEHPVSLGKAIQELRPNLTKKQARVLAETAEKWARETGKTEAKPTT